MNEHILQLKKGLKDGIPIGLGYLAVSFTFGIMAKGAGLTTLEAVVLSLTNLTSAGQFAGLGIITADHPDRTGLLIPALPAHLLPPPPSESLSTVFSPSSYVLWYNRRNFWCICMQKRDS